MLTIPSYACIDAPVVPEGPAEMELLAPEQFRRNMFTCFWFESSGWQVGDIERVGVANCLFETDFPHPTCLYPEPLRQVAPLLEGTATELRRTVLSSAAAQVYNLDPPG